jgi:aryl-alcohol dehydrogenase-like predicted oxidoreductase
MQFLGKTDLRVSVIGLGADHFGTRIEEKDAFYLIDAFLDAGGNLLDTANVYGRFTPGAGNASERVLGNWLRAGGRGALIATKGGHYTPGYPTVMRLSREEIESDLDTSLRVMGVDHIDFYWLHRDDPAREIGEIIETMEALVRAGKIRYYGASNYRTDRLCAADNYAKAHGLTGFSAVSNQYSVAKLNVGQNTNPDPTIVAVDDEALAYHTASGMPLVPFQATARGYFAKLAAGREISPALRAAYENEENRAIFASLAAFCEAQGCSMQTATLVATAKTPFQTVPITAVSAVGQMADVAAAMQMLTE